MGMQLLLTFEDVYPNDQPKNPEDYLKGCSREDIVKACSFFAAVKPLNSKFANFRVVAESIFGPDNNGFANEIYKKVREVEKSSGTRIFFNPISSLTLLEIGLRTPANPIEKTSAEFERGFFDAYLVLNSQFIKRQGEGINTTEKIEGYPQLPLFLFCTLYPDYDKINFDFRETFLAQSIKAIFLFEFLSKSERLEHLYKAFLNHFDVASWQEYLMSYFPITFSIIKKEKEEAHTILNLDPDEAGYEKSKNFIDKLALSPEAIPKKLDFTLLRSNPIFKLEEGKYLLLYDLFIIEKIFKGMYFQLSQINSSLPKNARVKEFKSHYGFLFSEQELLYRAMDSLYGGAKVKLAGHEMDSERIDGAPDYYVRQGKNILLFESKDFLIDSKSKLSYDLKTYEEVFKKKLYNDFDTDKPKAVVQLINFIKELLGNSFPMDQSFKYREVSIYPIIITHDIQYDVPGLDVMINTWFQEELDELSDEGYYIRKIKPLTIINIDTMLLHSVPLSSKIHLHKAIDAFHEHQRKMPSRKFRTKEEQDEFFLRKYDPFALFLSRYLQNKGWYEMPQITDIVRKPLFGE